MLIICQKIKLLEYQLKLSYFLSKSGGITPLSEYSQNF